MTSVGDVIGLMGAVGGIVGAAGGASVFVGRRKRKADTAAVLTGTAMTLVNELEEQALKAREEASQARAEAAAARREAADARQEASAYRVEVREELARTVTEVTELRTALREMVGFMHRVRNSILDDRVPREQLKAMVVAAPEQATRDTTT